MSEKLIGIRDWEVVTRGGPFTPPEGEYRLISGALVRDTVYPRKTYAAGKVIVSSPIISCEGRVVRTVNSNYELIGDPSEKYSKWCEDNGLKIDPDNPVKILVIGAES